MEWISVKDRMPEEYAKVITYRRGCPIDIHIEDIIDGVWTFDGILKNPVTYWMSFPEPPKEVE